MYKKLLKSLTFTLQNTTFFNCLLIFVLSVFGMNRVEAQVANYQVEQLPYGSGTTYSTVAPPAAFATLPNSSPPLSNLSTTRIDLEQAATSATFNDKIYTVALPFNFSFNGVTYPSGTIIHVSTNGFVAFGTAPLANNYAPISTNGSSGIISLYGRDMSLTNHSITGALPQISHYTINASPNRIFKIEWALRRKNVLTEDSNNMTFQLWLYETSNLIEFHYNTFNPNLGTGAALTGQIGLRGADNTDFINLSHVVNTSNWPAKPSQMGVGTVNNLASVVTRGGTGTTNAQIVNGSNRVFRFRPVTCFAPTGFSVASITSSTATLNWTAPSPVPSQGYQYYVTTSATLPNALTTPTGTVGAGVLTAGLAGLTPGVLHYVYVRSHCTTGPDDFSSWVGTTFSTLCSPTNVTYTQNFDGPVVPVVSPWQTNTVPTCTTLQTIGTSNPWVTSNVTPNYAGSGMTGNMLMYNGQLPGGFAADAWFYTQGINLTAGQQYKVSFRYGAGTTTTNRLRISYGLSPNNASMLLLDDMPNIKSSPLSNVIYFTAPTTNVYYFGLNAYSIANQGQMFVDDLVVEATTCLKPTTVSVANITQSSALLTWAEPSPAPSNGYAYYFSTSATAPTNSTPASGTVGTGATTITLTGLTSSTNYYFWVRSICGAELGEWVALNNSGSPFFTTLFVPVYCNPAPTSVDNQGITNITCGSINNTTGLEVGNYGNYSTMSTNVSPSDVVNVAITYTTGYDYYTKVWVDWNNNGSFLDAGENVYTGLSAASPTALLNASFTVPALQPIGQVRMRIGGSDTNDLTGTGAGQGPCYNGVWGTFEDYSLNVVVTPLPLSINIISSTQCANTNSPLVQITPAELANYQSYSWFPNVGVTGTAAAGYTFNTNSTTTYTLTGTMTSSPYSVRTLTYTYIASATPSPITITPSSTTVCPSGPAVQLTATGGIIPNIVVPSVSQNFNSGSGGWIQSTATIAPTHANGTVAASYWAIQNTGYNPGGSSGITSVNSNDNTPYYISNSDAQGSGSTTHVTLTSPVFSLGGYTDASVSFYHYYKAWTNGGAYFEITTNGSAPTPTWVTLQSWTSATQGTPTNFTQFIYNLNSYIGQTDLKIRFRYNTNWGYVWAVDNVIVTGSASSNVVWNNNATPVANGVVVPGLYLSYASSTVNTPYVAGTAAASVYALPLVDSTYLASVSTSAPVCTASNTVAVSVNPILGGTASSSQIICGGLPSDLTLTLYNGTITEWQYSNDLAFTTPVSIAFSGSATLTSAQMGSLTNDRYYRAVVTNGGCTSYSNVVSITFDTTNWNGFAWDNGLPTALKRATFSGNYTSSSDALLAASSTPLVLNACSVTVNSGAIVTFSPNYILNVENTVNTLGGTMNFLEGASLIQDNDVTNGVGVTTGGNLGDIHYTRSTTVVSEYDYTYWSSPVANQALSNVSPDSPNDYFFTFDPAVANWYNVPSINLMDVGKGYIIRAPYYANGTSGYPSTFIGTPNSGTITTPIVMGPTSATPIFRETNLIGNPYPSAINAIAFLSDAANVNNVEGTMYFWTHTTPITANNYSAADYAVFNYSGSTATSPGSGAITPNGYVAAGQSFMIKGINPIAPYPTGASVKSVTFRNSMRSGVGYSNSQFFRSASSHNDDQTAAPISEDVASIMNLERNRLWLDVSNADGLFKQALVGYVQNATDGFDRGFDGEIVNAGNQVSLYSMVDNKKLGIQAFALPFNSSDIIPLGFMSSIESSYTISLSNFDGLFNDQAVYLEDKMLNVIHNLKNSNYTFTTTIGTFEDRFQLRFTNALGVDNHQFNENSVVVFKQNHSIAVSTSSTLIDKVEVFDIRGRQLFSKEDINSNEFNVANLDVSQQVLIVRVTSVEGKIVNKKLIF